MTTGVSGCESTEKCLYLRWITALSTVVIHYETNKHLIHDHETGSHKSAGNLAGLSRI